jgi:hypothetical protein
MMPGCGAPMPPWACGELMPSGVRALCDACGGKPDPCSCDEALRLRDLLAIASRGKVAIHAVKEDGYWSVERWEGGKLVKGDIGISTAAEVIDRVSKFIRRIELQVNVTGNGERS